MRFKKVKVLSYALKDEVENPKDKNIDKRCGLTKSYLPYNV